MGQVCWNSSDRKRMKIAYLMLVHKDPQLLKKAVGTLDRRQYLFCEPRMPVYWAEYSQIEATMLLLRQALACPTIHVLQLALRICPCAKPALMPVVIGSCSRLF